MNQSNILVVEDNELNMKLVKSLLQLGGFQVLEAGDAEEGLRLLDDHLPELILMDIQLPNMDGLTATQKIKSDDGLKHIPVVALTSYAMQGDKQRALAAGCQGYITKPIDTREFLTHIQGYLAKPAPKSLEPMTSPAGGRPRVLIVDDDKLNVKFMSAKLQAYQFDTIVAYGGTEGIEKCHVFRPDLIILDVMMPDLDGYTVTRRLKRDPETAHIPIILLTALTGEDDRITGLEAGADEFLSKPVNTPELIARIKSMLRLKQYREQLQIRNQSQSEISAPKKEVIPQPATGIKPRIMLVEDDPRDRRLIHEYLSPIPCDIVEAENGLDAVDLAQKEKPDLILLDIVLPGMNGYEICQHLKTLDSIKHTQIVMITCLDDLDSKVKGVELGADDFLVKPINRREFEVRINALLKKKECLDQLESQYESAMSSAIRDGLTGLFNYAYFKHFLDLELKRAQRHNYATALIMLDIDDFKQINDTLGHQTGDDVLKHLAALLKNNLREIDMAARYGGEEFVAVLPYSNREEAVRVAERIRHVIQDNPLSKAEANTEATVTVSLGVAVCPQDADTCEGLIREADIRLYQAKRAGKNRVYDNTP